MENECIDVTIRVQQTESEDLAVFAPFKGTIFPAFSPAYLARMLSLNADQRRHVILHNDLPCGTSTAQPDWTIWNSMAEGEWRLPPIAERYFNVLQLAYQAAAAGEGVAMARAVCANRLITEGKLVMVPGARRVSATNYVVVALHPASRGSSVHVLVNWLIEQIELTRADTLSRLRTNAAPLEPIYAADGEKYEAK